MLRVYFDTNVFDRIDKGEVASTDLDALRRALSDRNLVANLSIVDVEELLGQWKTKRQAAIRKLQLARDLVGFDQILKQPSDLLADAFKAYASGQAAASYLMPPDQRLVVVSSLNRVIQGDTKLDRVVSESLEKVRLMIKGFRQTMTESRAEVLAQWQMIVESKGRTPQRSKNIGNLGLFNSPKVWSRPTRAQVVERVDSRDCLRSAPCGSRSVR
jgi:hypothetical protein